MLRLEKDEKQLQAGKTMPGKDKMYRIRIHGTKVFRIQLDQEFQCIAEWQYNDIKQICFLKF